MSSRDGAGGTVLRLESAERRYGDTVALAATGLALGSGTVTVVTGPNGSGKSTLLRLAAGLLRPTAGRRWACGRSLYLLGGQGARVVEPVQVAVATAAALSGATAPLGRSREALELVGLAGVAGQAAGTLSSGQRGRLTLALALACHSDLVCLDEPTAHLDEAGTLLVAVVLRRLRERGCAVLVATHERDRDGWPADAQLRLERGRARRIGPAAVLVPGAA
jgi:ABC-type multidrug transport system ATPase subunit